MNKQHIPTHPRLRPGALRLLLLAALGCFAVAASNGRADASGSVCTGTAVATVADLQNIGNNASASYCVMNNINAAGFNFIPIGTFSGNLDGQGFTVSNLTINTADYRVGLVGTLNGGTIENLGLLNENITGPDDVGGIAGGITGGSITASFTTGRVTATVSNGDSAGGIVGYAPMGAVSNNYSDDLISITGNTWAGGIEGWNGITVTDDYSAARITGTAGQSVIGGLVGLNRSTITNSYWDKSTTGISASSGIEYCTACDFGVGLTDAQMSVKSNFAGFDFNSVWDLTPKTLAYPHLRVFPPVAYFKSLKLKRSGRKTTISWTATQPVAGFNVLAGSAHLNAKLVVSTSKSYSFTTKKKVAKPSIQAEM